MLAFCPHGRIFYIQTFGEHLTKLCIVSSESNQNSICWKTLSIAFSKGKINLGQFFNVHNQRTATQTVSGLTPSSTQVLRSVYRSFVAKRGQRNVVVINHQAPMTESLYHA